MLKASVVMIVQHYHNHSSISEHMVAACLEQTRAELSGSHYCGELSFTV